MGGANHAPTDGDSYPGGSVIDSAVTASLGSIGDLGDSDNLLWAVDSANLTIVDAALDPNISPIAPSYSGRQRKRTAVWFALRAISPGWAGSSATKPSWTQSWCLPRSRSCRAESTSLAFRRSTSTTSLLTKYTMPPQIRTAASLTRLILTSCLD